MRGEGSSGVLIVRRDRSYKLTNLWAKTSILNRFVLAHSALIQLVADEIDDEIDLAITGSHNLNSGLSSLPPLMQFVN